MHLLHRRGKMYYLRAFVPSDVAPFVGRKEIWKSLRTNRKAEALRRLQPLSQDLEKQFSLARQHRDAMLAARRPGRKKKPRSAQFQSPTDALAHDLAVIEARWQKKPPNQDMDVRSFYDALKSLSEAFPKTRLTEVIAALEVEETRRKPAIEWTKPDLRIVKSDDDDE